MNTARTISKLARVILAVTVLLATLGPVMSPGVSASDFGIHIMREYRVLDDAETMHITETRTVTAYSSSYFIPTSSSETFSIQNFKGELTEDELSQKQESLVIKEYGGSDLNHTLEIEGDTLLLSHGNVVAIGRHLIP